MEKHLKRDSSSVKSSAKISFFTRILLKWFDANGRKFPWRSETDPFKILIAEIMLQRTKAQQVVPVYLEFTECFPNIESMSSVRATEINIFITKLGLQWRTGLIVKMIRELSSKFANHIPQEKMDLLALPGVGDYISDAVMVFGFDRRTTIVDSNVVRLVSRFFGIPMRGELRRKKEFRVFCNTLVEKVPKGQIKSFNWALIDLPSVICIKNPRCRICPLSENCSYFANNLKVGRPN